MSMIKIFFVKTQNRYAHISNINPKKISSQLFRPYHRKSMHAHNTCTILFIALSCQIFSHLRLWIAAAIHNLKWLKIVFIRKIRLYCIHQLHRFKWCFHKQCTAHFDIIRPIEKTCICKKYCEFSTYVFYSLFLTLFNVNRAGALG